MELMVKKWHDERRRLWRSSRWIDGLWIADQGGGQKNAKSTDGVELEKRKEFASYYPFLLLLRCYFSPCYYFTERVG